METVTGPTAVLQDEFTKALEGHLTQGVSARTGLWVGVGFDPGTAARSNTRGIGLMGIRERLAPVGGALSIDAAPGRRTELRVVIPCP